ncbi:MAG: 4-hydroxythreonine-4-phosphate dehydrogenase PdxA [Spirochaetes bacterium]|nr:4-hydroxythreonine-4-phosphate dehydrogenase PdxA [Spirochaetota bacterium]
MKKIRQKNNIAITTGDPASIGPEVVLQALSSFNRSFDFTPVVIGDYEFLRGYYQNLFDKLNFKVSNADLPDISPGVPNFINLKNVSLKTKPGTGSSDSGRASLEYIDCSIDLWKKGIINAVSTAPVNKGFICRAGYSFSGHTEYYARKTGNNEPFMMMYSDKYRVILVSTHHRLFNLEKLITYESILETIKTAASSIEKIDLSRPKLAVCGLDPHCGDNGAIGNFDNEVTVKAISDARAAGIDVSGPFAADTVFIPGKWENYSCVIAHYHDQGLIPFKMLAFENGVNVTLGLPIVRTSADHGTAYDIAGKGIAGFMSMKKAIIMADSLSAV